MKDLNEWLKNASYLKSLLGWYQYMTSIPHVISN
jgi:hypothetical protein